MGEAFISMTKGFILNILYGNITIKTKGDTLWLIIQK